MSNVSLHAVDQFFRPESEDPCLMLLTLNFPNNNSFYFVNNTEDITSNGQVFTAFPFQFTLPNDTSDGIPELQITLSNIGLELIDDLSETISGITSRVDLIFASNPDLFELSITDLEVKNISYDNQQIVLFIGYDDILNTSIPSDTYNPKNFPGVFSV